MMMNRVIIERKFVEELEPREQLVMIALLMKHENGHVRYNARELARITGLSHRCVRTIYKRLLNKGTISCHVLMPKRSPIVHLNECVLFSLLCDGEEKSDIECRETDDEVKDAENIVVTESDGEENEGDAIIDLNAFKKFWNDSMKNAGSVIPSIVSIKGKRKMAVKSRMREHGKASLGEVIRKCAVSDFLNGKNQSQWVANFDWVFKPNNYIKILEGNYDNGKDYQANSTKYDIEREKRYSETADLVARLLSGPDEST